MFENVTNVRDERFQQTVLCNAFKNRVHQGALTVGVSSILYSLFSHLGDFDIDTRTHPRNHSNKFTNC